MVEFSNPAAYERWMGRWSRRLAPSFISFANLSNGTHLLDIGSGTGALSEALLVGVPNSTVVGVEPSEAYVSLSRERLSNERLEFKLGNALDLPFEDDSFDASLSLLILQELSDASLALREMRRVTRPGGSVVASQWDFASGMPMLSLFWNAVVQVVRNEDAKRAVADCMVVDYPDEAALRSLWQETGLIEIMTERQPLDMTFSSFEDYWSPFLSNVTPTSSYVGKLEHDKATEIESCLRSRLRRDAADQSFCLMAHAWAIRGKVPS